ncbi:protein-L-isoaspartate (D-aspartate) O-methyltransferase [Deferribacter desulfuricans SSM1]|uniref:Protein-L-isoaspartate O-methyltransferase n=1 Tax=Deferribacter desulfuricans (strain DSM 14783 / JCM 11476 / NBRC 101012 / SSM1) TaxID=639282 RepID=D3P9G1_DEFDS|nr:protein-L-isoaspartate(D-aspartate) O-methyltransferase [Deferribacter desulfuricans]BAI81351.1 protein-L-isoaspartate (D-aspartate) O-methyltransferase [Deferribacter desulfuricans SSM1]
MSFEFKRMLMVKEQLQGRDVKDKRVLDAFLNVPRELFVLEEYKDRAYDDSPLPIGYGQTISQPYMVAKMTELLDLNEDDILLEIGTGSGYQAAIASRLCKHVYTVEIIPELVDFAKSNLKKAGIKNVTVILGDGSVGLKDYAPYDKIIITAATESVPEELFEQLKVGGYLVVPEGDRFTQWLKRYIKLEEGKIVSEDYSACVFVPLRGKKGFK